MCRGFSKTRTLIALLALSLTAKRPASGECFVRGDSNTDGLVNISDPIFSLSSLFLGGVPTSCEDAQDANDDGILDLSDAVFTLSWRFLGVGSMPMPFPDCGQDPTGDQLGCSKAPCRTDSSSQVPDRVFTLETGRVGLPYRGALPTLFQEETIVFPSVEPPRTLREAIPFEGYCVRSSIGLPPGLELDESTGVVHGIPEVAGSWSILVKSTSSLRQSVVIRANLAVFSEAEEEIVSGQALEEAGPHPVDVIDSGFDYTHLFPWPPPYELWDCTGVIFPNQAKEEHKLLRVYYPADATEPAPALIFHHGFGFSHLDYESTLVHVASHGVIAVSVADDYPYGVRSFSCGLAQQESAWVMLATRDHLEQLASESETVLSGLLDTSRIFYAGHSRGGGSAIIAGELDPRTCGIIALQPTDPKEDPWIGSTNRSNILPRVPILLISAEQERDTIYPLAERMLERVRGSGTMVTVYGGCHGYTTDTSHGACLKCEYVEEDESVDDCLYISRSLQQGLTRKFVIAFLRRHAFADLSLEGTLYGSEFQRSPYVSLASQRNLSTTLVVDDFSRFPENTLGLPTSWSKGEGIAVSVGSSYDLPEESPPAPFPPIKNLILSLPLSGELVYRSTLAEPGASLDPGPRKRLVLRIHNIDHRGRVDNAGFDWLGLSVTLVDSHGGFALVPLDDQLPTSRFHPDPQPAGAQAVLKYQRHMTIGVALADFTRVNPEFDLHSLRALELRFVTNSSSTVTPSLGIDDIRFE